MKLKIYIVEDSPIIAAALKKMVTVMGHSVAGIAASYEDAITEIMKMDIDTVITDIMLAGQKNGVDLGAYVKEHLNVPVIYQSSITDAHLILRAMSTEPLAYLIKPVTRMELTNALLSVDAA
ncbi:response regulator [Mucilaginibacter ximonensis]|uniref:Response regulator n=1 Tax=Mucilaginibacter ximonensis TaxID=538021 RepID=A0ABW5YC91_9SPHI